MIVDTEKISLNNRFENDIVKKYYYILQKKKLSLIIKRAFDIVVSCILLVALSPIILAIAVAIKLNSPGNVVFKQQRITKCCKPFYIYKFRTMVENAESIGSQVTVDNDKRITGVGHILRRYRLDELLQLINIIKGEMSFVGTRPEVRKYVESYSDEMFATLLLPAGVTSLASIYYKDEDKLLAESENADETYVSKILPQKMKYNLEYLKCFSFLHDIKIMFMTIFAVCRKEEYFKQHENDENEVKINV